MSRETLTVRVEAGDKFLERWRLGKQAILFNGGPDGREYAVDRAAFDAWSRGHRGRVTIIPPDPVAEPEATEEPEPDPTQEDDESEGSPLDDVLVTIPGWEPDNPIPAWETNYRAAQQVAKHLTDHGVADIPGNQSHEDLRAAIQAVLDTEGGDAS